MRYLLPTYFSYYILYFFFLQKEKSMRALRARESAKRFIFFWPGRVYHTRAVAVGVLDSPAPDPD